MTVGVPTVGTLFEKVGLGTSAAVPYPATNAGELMILAVNVKNATQPTLPAGWTTIVSQSNLGTSTQPAQLLAYKVATGSETGNLSVTIPAVSVAAQIWSVPGVDTSNPLNVAASAFNQTTASSSITIPGVTTGSDGCLLVVLAADNGTTHTATPPTGFTETANLTTGQQSIGFAYKQQTSAGASGSAQVVWNGSGQAIGVLVAISPRVTNASSPTVTVAANDATVVTTSFVNVAAGNAAVTVAANDALGAINNPTAEAALVGVDALDATVSAESLFTTFDEAAGTLVVPGVPVRVRAVWDDVVYYLWSGAVDSWDLSYLLPTYSQAVANCTDITKRIAINNRPAQTILDGEGEDTGARIDRILDSVAWGHTDRVIATGDSTLQATDLSGNAWSEILDAVASEAGEVFADPTGRVVFRNRRSVLTAQNQTVSQAVFGDQLTAVKNLLDNADFETGISSWTPGGATNTPVTQWTSDVVYDGHNSMRLIFGAGGPGPYVQTRYSSATIGQTYTVSAYVYATTGCPDLQIGVDGIGVGAATSVKNSWTRISFSFNADRNPFRVRIYAVTLPVGGEVCYIDDAQLEVGPIATVFGSGEVPSELPVYDVEFSYDDDTLWNTIGVTNTNGVRQEAVDGKSQQRYGTRSIEMTDTKLETDQDAADLAGYLLYLSSTPELRISSLTIRPSRDPQRLFPVVLSLGWGDRITVNLTDPRTGLRLSQDCFIRGVSHSIDPGRQWDTKYITQAASTFAFWTIGDPVLGKLGDVALSF